VLSSGAGTGVVRVERQLQTIVRADNTRIMSVAGPEITKVRQAA
jgi:hypothetical protein